MTDFSPKRRGRPPHTTGPVVQSPPPASAEMRGGPPAEPVKLADVIPSVATLREEHAEASSAEAQEQNARLAKRRRRAKVGGLSMKLSAPPRPGFMRRWFNDSGNRLAEAEELGYDFVQDTGLKTSQPGSRVSRLVGTQANGEPLHAFLMETPDELYAEGEAEKEAVARQVDEAISRGKATSDGQMSQIPESETYGHGEVRPDR